MAAANLWDTNPQPSIWSARLDAFVQQNCLEADAERVFRKQRIDVQSLVMQQGRVTGHHKSAILRGRIRLAYQAKSDTETLRSCVASMPTVVVVTEKSSVAKSWTRAILQAANLSVHESIDSFNTVNTKGAPIYKFLAPFSLSGHSASVHGDIASWTVTCTRGHIQEMTIGERMSPSSTCFDKPVMYRTNQAEREVERQLVQAARGASILILAPDADHEGEHIAHEVATACSSHMQLDAHILRCKFTSHSPRQLVGQLLHLCPINAHIVDAVDLRRELDLKAGELCTIALRRRLCPPSQKKRGQYDVTLSLHQSAASPDPGFTTPSLTPQNNLLQKDMYDRSTLLQHRYSAYVNAMELPKNAIRCAQLGSASGNDAITAEPVRTNIMAATSAIPLEPKQPTVVHLVPPYGPCQTPTLFFAVHHAAQQMMIASALQQYRVAVSVESEATGRFETFSAALSQEQAEQERLGIHFAIKAAGTLRMTHARHSFYHKADPSAKQTGPCMEKLQQSTTKPEARVTRTWSTLVPGLQRPRPMDTLTLQRVASTALGFMPDETMRCAQELYEHNLISYPRSESSVYQDGFNAQKIVASIAESSSWVMQMIDTDNGKLGTNISVKEYARKVLQQGPLPPREDGRDAPGQVPITPLPLEEAYGEEEEAEEEEEQEEEEEADPNELSYRALPLEEAYWEEEEEEEELSYQALTLYEFILRYFLASVSPDCVIEARHAEFQVEIDVPFAGVFRVQSRHPRELGWAEVLPIQRAVQFPQIGASGAPKICGHTLRVVNVRMEPLPPHASRPLTVGELLQRMEEHGLGTDGTMAKIIDKLIKSKLMSCRTRFLDQPLPPDIGYVDSFNASQISNNQHTGTLIDEWYLSTRRPIINVLQPTYSGFTLVCWLWRHQQNLVLPSVRSDVEGSCLAVANGVAEKCDIQQAKLAEFKQHFEEFSLKLQGCEGTELERGLQGQTGIFDSVVEEIARMDLTELQASRATTIASFGVSEDDGSVREPYFQPEDVRSAPAAIDMRQCLIPGTLVRIRRNDLATAVDVSTISAGDLLMSGCGVEATVRSCRPLQNRERDIVRLALRMNDALHVTILIVTANHSVPALRTRSRQYEVLHAHEVEVGDQLRTHRGAVTVVAKESSVRSTPVIEIELENVHSTIFVGGLAGDLGQPLFIEVYGELVPMRPDESVKLLRFSRFERFREALLQGPELRPCREALQRHEFSADLGRYGMGAGKMFVQPELAERVLNFLRDEYGQLRAGDVVVSRAYEHVVLEAVRRREGVRTAYLLEEQPLDLSHIARLWHTIGNLHLPGEPALFVRRTFLDIQQLEMLDARTQSTTDLRYSQLNPRRRMPEF